MGLIHDFSEYSYSFLTHWGGRGRLLIHLLVFETYFEFLKYLTLFIFKFFLQHIATAYYLL